MSLEFANQEVVDFARREGRRRFRLKPEATGSFNSSPPILNEKSPDPTILNQSPNPQSSMPNA
jgi:hypothetical protein